MKRSIEKKRSVKEKRISWAKSSKGITLDQQLAADVKSSAGVPENLQACAHNMTVLCIKHMYQIPDAPTNPIQGNGLGLYEQGDYFAKGDLDLYWENINPLIPAGTYPTPNLIDGANFSVPITSTTLDQGESNIDIEMA